MISKKSLRREFKEMRQLMDRHERKECDRLITESFLTSNAYAENGVLLSYVSTDIEVDTYSIIDKALNDGKRVYVPKCYEGSIMRFFRIFSFSDLAKGYFEISEPSGETEEYDGESAVCIVPALSYDPYGGRLGYGMGFYDRFLSANRQLNTVGLCYESNIMPRLPVDEYDISVKKIITEVRTIDTEV